MGRRLPSERRLRQTVEAVLGLAPATFVLLPFLFVGGLATAMAVIANGAVDRGSAVLFGWILAGVLGIAALWVVVLGDGAGHVGRRSRLLLAIGLLLGMAAAVRWLWVMGTSVHRYGPATWAVWLVLLGGPLVVASLRLAQLLSSLRDKTASPSSPTRPATLP